MQSVGAKLRKAVYQFPVRERKVFEAWPGHSEKKRS